MRYITLPELTSDIHFVTPMTLHFSSQSKLHHSITPVEIEVKIRFGSTG